MELITISIEYKKETFGNMTEDTLENMTDQVIMLCQKIKELTGKDVYANIRR